jgi:hypothetical protein
MSDSDDPPAMLVKTWLYILTTAEDNDTRRHAKEMLENIMVSLITINRLKERHR